MESEDKKIVIPILIIIILAVALGLIIKIGVIDKNKSNSEEASSTEEAEIIEESKNVSVQTTGETSYTDFDSKIDLSKMTSSGSGVSINGSTVKISSGGVYYFTGTLSDGKIEVEAKGEEVILVLDGVDITCKTTSPLNIIKAETVIINLVDGSENVFTDGSEYSEFTEDDEPDGTIFSKADLYINGSGTLKVNGNYEDAIVSKDSLVIEGTNIEVSSADDGIRGKDFVSIKDAKITVNSDGDGIKSTNDTDKTLGYVIVEDSEITINAGSDGIEAATFIKINSGTINIKDSYEGIEATYIEINGGDITIEAKDDGINISGGNDSSAINGRPGENDYSNSANSDRKLMITGGKIYVSSQGDGLDSNGSIEMTGGYVVVAGSVNGGNGALDYDQSFNITGGTLIAYGANGMWQNPSNSSSQYSICFGVTGKSGDKLVLKDSNGNEIASTEATKAYGAIVISSSDLKQGETYSLFVNGSESSSQTLTSIVTSNLSGEMNGGMPGGGMQTR
ncbi:MAG: carbohydrate-binding domain-containing protein [Clostridia bacterium]|nr:carbohydrate-binding domain-containing protein [Clostridia bacterium]